MIDDHRAALLILSADGTPPAAFAKSIAAGLLQPVRQIALENHQLARARGLVTTMHLDQIDFAARASALIEFFDRGGRLAFMGHLARPFLPELTPFIPLASGRRIDFRLVANGSHPIFEGIDRALLETRRGVAGFYGRGYAPIPRGGRALTGIGPEKAPIDWVWERPEGGEILMHSGNDLWSVCDDAAVNILLAERLTAWCAGAGETFDHMDTVPFV
ncbi:hypothetical protein [Methylocystis sp. Sn-Cys]|uniref:hypothetical protein n=1 Tax=Methylocystis sp. Sn-Cys TaxID=1701263 RepID=UPI001FEF2D1C|nr:hypothetical protein [Methylocystis sp. Sn-Cys]